MMRAKLAATPMPWKMETSMAPLATGMANTGLGRKMKAPRNLIAMKLQAMTTRKMVRSVTALKRRSLTFALDDGLA